MWVKRMSATARQRTTDAIFTGNVERQGVVGDEVSKQLYVGEITFKDGGANKWHVHTVRPDPRHHRGRGDRCRRA